MVVLMVLVAERWWCLIKRCAADTGAGDVVACIALLMAAGGHGRVVSVAVDSQHTAIC